jgi:hypothetical protein
MRPCVKSSQELLLGVKQQSKEGGVLAAFLPRLIQRSPDGVDQVTSQPRVRPKVQRPKKVNPKFYGDEWVV